VEFVLPLLTRLYTSASSIETFFLCTTASGVLLEVTP